MLAPARPPGDAGDVRRTEPLSTRWPAMSKTLISAALTPSYRLNQSGTVLVGLAKTAFAEGSLCARTPLGEEEGEVSSSIAPATRAMARTTKPESGNRNR